MCKKENLLICLSILFYLMNNDETCNLIILCFGRVKINYINDDQTSLVLIVKHFKCRFKSNMFLINF